jgi:hypothetical protein
MEFPTLSARHRDMPISPPSGWLLRPEENEDCQQIDRAGVLQIADSHARAAL